MEQEIAIRRKRLFFLSCHRGTKEADLVLGSFANRHLNDFVELAITQFETLLNEPDHDILDWALSRCPVPAKKRSHVLDLLIAHMTKL